LVCRCTLLKQNAFLFFHIASNHANQAIEPSPILVSESCSLPHPPLLESTVNPWDIKMNSELLLTVVPDFPGANTLHKDVLSRILLLKAKEARRGSILKTVSRPTIRCPNHVLSCQPAKELALRGSLAVPNCFGQDKSDAPLQKHVISRGRSVSPRSRPGPGKAVWRVVVAPNSIHCNPKSDALPGTQGYHTPLNIQHRPVVVHGLIHSPCVACSL
jgi:hypothetical protein